MDFLPHTQFRAIGTGSVWGDDGEPEPATIYDVTATADDGYTITSRCYGEFMLGYAMERLEARIQDYEKTRSRPAALFELV